MGTSNNWSEQKKTEKTGKNKSHKTFFLCAKKDCFEVRLQNFQDSPFFAGNQTRTGTPFDQRGILSPLCLPFHHPGGMNHYIIFSQFIQVGNLKTSFKNSKMSF